MNIGYKTTGTLLNELITAGLKWNYIGSKPEFWKRMRDITLELEKRGLAKDNKPTEIYNSIEEIYVALANTLIEMWDVVEEITRLRKMENKAQDKWEELGRKADKSFQLNAERTEYIRRIDKILGEGEYTFLEKSYN